MRRGQTALEFLILTGFMLFVFTAFFFVIRERSSIATQQLRYQELNAIGDIISSEATIASQVKDGYSRVFELPYTANGEAYTIILPSPSEVNIRTQDQEYLLFLNTNVSAQGGILLPGKNLIRKLQGNITITPIG